MQVRISRLLGLILTLFITVQAQAQPPRLNARALGLGQSTVALPADYAAAGNPAGLGQADALAIQFSQSRLAYDCYAYQLLAIVPATANSALAVRFDQQITQNSVYFRLLYNPDGTLILDPVTNQPALQLAYDTRIDSYLGFAYGLTLVQGISAGVEIQASHYILGEDYAWGWDGIAGMAVDIEKNLQLGLVIKQISGEWHAWRRPYCETCARPELEAGVGYYHDLLHTRLVLAMVQLMEWNQLPKARVGLEYTGLHPLSLRAGWDIDHLNIGAGLKWEMITLDYTIITSGAFYDANRITVSIRF